MHKNNPAYSFLFEGFNLWKHVLFKEIEINSRSNGALTKSRPSFSMTLYNFAMVKEIDIIYYRYSFFVVRKLSISAVKKIVFASGVAVVVLSF